jgi:hypothetical protein
MVKDTEKPKEEASESSEVIPGQIEAHPTAYTYVVEVSGEKIGTEDPVMAVVLSKLEQNSQDIKKILEAIEKAQGKE